MILINILIFLDVWCNFYYTDIFCCFFICNVRIYFQFFFKRLRKHRLTHLLFIRGEGHITVVPIQFHYTCKIV